MSLSAALRIASRVVLPSRVLPVGLGVSVGVLVVVICTNRSVQKLPPMKHRVKPAIDPLRSRPDRGAPDTEERHGSAGALRVRRGGLARWSGDRGASRLRRDASEPPGVSPPGVREPRSVTAPPRRFRAARGLAPGGQGTEERHGSAATLPSRPGVKGALRGPLTY